MPVTYSFFVPDIRCINCHEPIKEALRACTELKLAAIDIDDKEINISLSEGMDETFLQQKITEVLKAAGHSPVFSDELFQEQTKEQTTLHWFQGAVGSASGFALLMLSLFAGPISLSLMIPLALVSGALTLVLGAASYKRAFLEWRNAKRLSMDSLFAVSTAIVLLVSAASFFVPWLPMMLDTGLLIFGFRHLGLAIEGSLTRVMQFNTRFVDRLPQTLRVKKENGFEEQPLHTVKVGEIIEIQPGAIIPLDGECLNAEQLIYDSIITGAYLPRKAQRNEVLLSGMVVAEEGETLLLRVTESLDTSHLKRRDQRISKAKFENKADFEIFAKKILNYFIPSVFLLATLPHLVAAHEYYEPIIRSQ